eukprot:11997213-Prorocentrum_lima.AAC.1
MGGPVLPPPMPHPPPVPALEAPRGSAAGSPPPPSGSSAAGFPPPELAPTPNELARHQNAPPNALELRRPSAD